LRHFSELDDIVAWGKHHLAFLRHLNSLYATCSA
jgi:hypothetical protein